MDRIVPEQVCNKDDLYPLTSPCVQERHGPNRGAVRHTTFSPLAAAAIGYDRGQVSTSCAVSAAYRGTEVATSTRLAEC
eukprot:COSAG02_NODE_1178_length_14042_cov_11.526674_13_plen_79_part_00